MLAPLFVMAGKIGIDNLLQQFVVFFAALRSIDLDRQDAVVAQIGAVFPLLFGR